MHESLRSRPQFARDRRLRGASRTAIGSIPTSSPHGALKKKGESIRPRNPHETFADHSCATVGPMGCRGQPTIDVFTAAAALATMADRLVQGPGNRQHVRDQPTESEYQLYLEAKKEREAAEADKAAKAKAAAAQAAADAAPNPALTATPERTSPPVR